MSNATSIVPAIAASLVEALASPEFVAIGVFCAIGLLLTFNVMLRWQLGRRPDDHPGLSALGF